VTGDLAAAALVAHGDPRPQPVGVAVEA